MVSTRLFGFATSFLIAIITVTAEDRISSWVSPRGAIVQDVALIEGGKLYRNTFENGMWTGQQNITPPAQGLLYRINLCNAINLTDGDPDQYLAHQEDPPETTKGPYKNYIGGAMFATDYEFYTYGGASYPDIEDNSTVGITYGDLYKDNSDVSIFNPGFDDSWGTTENKAAIANITTHRAYGSWANAPREKLGFYFSGLEAANGGYINQINSNKDGDVPNTLSTKLMQVDMSTQNSAKWQEFDLPSLVTPRAAGGLVWLPFGQQGILISFGGFYSLPDITKLPKNDTDLGNTFMTDIAVYDVAGEKWYLQPSLESVPKPSAMRQFCTAVTAAQDNSSYFVYVYGGYDGESSVSDSIWVLSVPAFQWTLIDEGQASSHGRMGHICVTPSPTQMLSIGGSEAFEHGLTGGDTIDVYDMSATQWTHYYDPASTALYEVPTKITDQIGGTKTGHFTVPSELQSDVHELVSTPYPKYIQGYAPRRCASNNGSSTPTIVPSKPSKPSWETPLIAALASVAGVAIICTAIWCCFFKRRRWGSSEATASKRRSILSWGARVDHPAPKSVLSEDTAVTNPVDYFAPKFVEANAYELSDTGQSPHPLYSGHASPQLISPASPLSASDGDTPGRFEMENNSTTNPRESMSIRDHPAYPHNVGGLSSNRSENASHLSASGMRYAQREYFELPYDRSRENVAQLPGDDEATRPLRNSGIARKPVKSSTPVHSPTGASRPSHHRHDSSLSTGVPNLPSPGAEEDRRMSQHLDSLADAQRTESQQSRPRITGHVHNIYSEDFNDNGSMTTRQRY